MSYTSVRLQNFRSYVDHSVEFSESVNIVVGPNASGKTNLLESLYVLNMGGSFRVEDQALVHNQKTWARIDGQTEDSTRSLLLKIENEKLTKELELDGSVKKRFSSVHAQPTTLFEPEHLRFLTGSPELRRSYLDTVIYQTLPAYKRHLNQYRRALTQRNRLLKHRPTGWKDQLFVWDLKLSDFGEEIYRRRSNLVASINEKTDDIYSKISDEQATLSLEYSSSLGVPDDYRSALLAELQSRSERDAERGFTSTGPHRDDLLVSLNGGNAHLVASRGETRTIVLVLKIIELQLLDENSTSRPLLLLDDVFSELDGARRRALTTYLADYQTIITTTDADAILKHFMGEHRVIPTGG